MIAALNRYVHDLHVEAEPDKFHPTTQDEVEPFFAGILARPDHFVFVASLAEAVGYVWAQHIQRDRNAFKNASNNVSINHVAVATGHRRSGVASALCEAVEGEAMKRGARAIVLDHWTFNEDARRFFEAAGFTNFNVRMRRPLPD